LFFQSATRQKNKSKKVKEKQMPTKILAKLENINKELQHKYCNNKKMTMKQTKKQNKKQ
jgi:hypothetical protein